VGMGEVKKPASNIVELAFEILSRDASSVPHLLREKICGNMSRGFGSFFRKFL